MPVQHVRVESLAPPKVERVGASRGRSSVAIAAVAVLVLVALVKPWQSGPSSSQLRLVPVPPPATDLSAPTPTVDADVTAILDRMLCPPTWRLVTMESGALGDSRTEYGTPPGPGSGPNDPRIPVIELWTQRLNGIGLCRPLAGTAEVPFPVDEVSLWTASSDHPTPISQLTVLDQGLYRYGEAYFGPPPATGDPVLAGRATWSWQPGRYVFEIADAYAAQPLWLALDFTVPPRGTASPPPG